MLHEEKPVILGSTADFKAIDKGYFCVAGVAASFEAACFPRCKLRYLFKKLLSIFLSRFGICGPF